MDVNAERTVSTSSIKELLEAAASSPGPATRIQSRSRVWYTGRPLEAGSGVIALGLHRGIVQIREDDVVAVRRIDDKTFRVAVEQGTWIEELHTVQRRAGDDRGSSVGPLPGVVAYAASSGTGFPTNEEDCKGKAQDAWNDSYHRTSPGDGEQARTAAMNAYVNCVDSLPWFMQPPGWGSYPMLPWLPPYPLPDPTPGRFILELIPPLDFDKDLDWDPPDPDSE